MQEKDKIKEDKIKEDKINKESDIRALIFSALEKRIEDFQKKEWRSVVFLPNTRSYKNVYENNTSDDSRVYTPEKNKNEESEKNFPKIIEYRTTFKQSWLEKNILSLARIEQHTSFSPRMKYEIFVYTTDSDHYSRADSTDPKYYPDNDILFWNYHNIRLPVIILNYPPNLIKKENDHVVMPLSKEDDDLYKSQMEEVKILFKKVNNLFREEEKKEYEKRNTIQEIKRRNQLTFFYDSIKKYFLKKSKERI